MLAGVTAPGYNAALPMNFLSRRAPFLFIILLVAFPGARTNAQNVRNIAEHEIARRQAGVLQGQGALARGKLALQAKDFAKAHDEFRVAASFLPDALATAAEHDGAIKGFCESGVKLAEQRVAEGKYGEAEQVVREVVSDRYDPNCRAALDLLAHLSEPGYFNKTMGTKFIAKVEDVKKLLVDADGYYNSGRYDLAFKKYEQVLNLDPYNVAARRGEERIDNTKTHYGQEAYNETRSRKLWQVQKGWEEPVRQYGQSVGPISDAFARDAGGTARITNKLNSINPAMVEVMTQSNSRSTRLKYARSSSGVENRAASNATNANAAVHSGGRHRP